MSTITAEVRKAFAGKLWWIFLLAGLGLSAITIIALIPDHVTAIQAGTGSAQAALDDATRYWMTLYLAAGCLIAYLTAGEFTDGQMQRSILLNRLNRTRVAWTKFAAAIIIATFFGLTAATLAWTTPTLITTAYGIDLTGTTIDTQIIVGVLTVNILAGIWGYGLGLLLRNPVAAVSLFVVQTLFLETYGARAFPEIGKYLLTSTMGSLYKDPSPLSIAMLPALAIALAWVLTALTAGITTVKTRDV